MGQRHSSIGSSDFHRTWNEVDKDGVGLNKSQAKIFLKKLGVKTSRNELDKFYTRPDDIYSAAEFRRVLNGLSIDLSESLNQNLDEEEEEQSLLQYLSEKVDFDGQDSKEKENLNVKKDSKQTVEFVRVGRFDWFSLPRDVRMYVLRGMEDSELCLMDSLSKQCKEECEACWKMKVVSIIGNDSHEIFDPFSSWKLRYFTEHKVFCANEERYEEMLEASIEIDEELWTTGERCGEEHCQFSFHATYADERFSGKKFRGEFCSSRRSAIVAMAFYEVSLKSPLFLKKQYAVKSKKSITYGKEQR